MDIKNHIAGRVEELLEDPSLFLVEVILSEGKARKLTIVLDGDNGVSIEDCTRLGRKLGRELEESDLISEAFVLDVTSPGVDTPLQTLRQYLKNRGREVRVKTLDNDFKGILKEVSEKEIVLYTKATKKIPEKVIPIPFDEIKSTTVQISFK